ncbi:hypothetical protein N7522_001771 [Penicillium canescens]|nr:hypothetical protein N7522_001771 [Penicillium canescens]
MKDDAHLQQMSEKLWGKSKELVKKPAGEAEWTEALHATINDFKFKGLEIVRNRDWREDLKPPVHNPRPTIPRKRSQSYRLVHETANDRHPSPAAESVPPSPAIPTFRLKTPRPDICVGLSDQSLINDFEPMRGRSAARSFLLDLQDTTSLISDPHVTPLGLRFPFLIVEAKAGATGGNLYQAQNQAAVGGSTALQILRNLSELKSPQILDWEGQESSRASNRPIETLSELASHMVFSVTTESPIHELWLHFRRPGEEDFYMVCIGAWRTTVKGDSLNFLRYLWAVLRWGNNGFRDSIVGALGAL